MERKNPEMTMPKHVATPEIVRGEHPWSANGPSMPCTGFILY
jgi:hypothetical protein